MFRFENPYLSLWLVSIIICIAILWFVRQYSNQRVAFLGTPSTVKRLFDFSKTIPNTIITLVMCLGLFSSVIGLMNPQWGYHNKKVDATSADIFIAMDLSNSMNTTDIAPSRLEKAKQIAEMIVQSSQGDRVSLIYFAATAFMQMPLTNDYSTARMFIRSAQTNLITAQGTSISDAIKVGLRSNKTDNEGKKVMLIISDGEDHEEQIERVVKEAVSKDWIISTIGVGTADGGMIPVDDNGRESYLYDEDGNPITSKLNEDALQHIADLGHGKYFAANDTGIATELVGYLEKMDRKVVQSHSFSDMNSYYMYFVAVALALFIAVFIMMYSYKPKQN